MFDVLSRGFKNARLKLQGRAELNEQNISEALREVRTSLIQADVQIKVAREFVRRVKVRVLGDVVQLKARYGPEVSPADYFIKACYDELVELMGPVDASLSLDDNPSVIMLVGLQGSGKTTTAGKLAKRFLDEGKKPMMVAADIYRPAAVDQLMVLGRQLDVPVFSIKGMKPVQLSTLAVKQARSVKRDVVIIDTAGRLAIDNPLMDELEQIKTKVKPQNILFVVDAMIGQDAVRTAAEFDRRLDFDGFILTKLDGDARGGAALSIKEVTGKPVKFLGQGEALDKLEEFRPEGLAQRILGFGDVVGLMKDFERHVDPVEAEKDAMKMLKGDFTYEDFVKQMQTVRRMGSLRELVGRIPFLSGMLEQIPEEALDDRQMDRTLAIIQSMTNQERNWPDMLNQSRFRRISRGCGRSIKEVEELHERFRQAREMMGNLGGMMGMGGPMQMMQMQRQLQQMTEGAFPGMPPGDEDDAKRKSMSPDERLARRKKQKAARKSRKRNRRK